MIEIENEEIVGWEAAIRGMRNPMNSWEKSDSGWFSSEDDMGVDYVQYNSHSDLSELYFIGQNDYDLMKRLRNAGTEHRKFMRMITVYVDITAPLYWWKEFDTYKVGTVANSCSTMHKIADKEFELSDFSHEHLLDVTTSKDNESVYLNGIEHTSRGVLLNLIDCLNHFRRLYLKTKDKKYLKLSKIIFRIKNISSRLILDLATAESRMSILHEQKTKTDMFSALRAQHWWFNAL